MEKKIIYLNYKQYYSYMNIAHSHRTSNGFKYSCYDAIEMTGPFFSEELPQFDDADKALMLSITNTPIGEKITWEDDDCWAESFCGQSRNNHYCYNDCGVCAKLNSLLGEKYHIDFRPSEKEIEAIKKRIVNYPFFYCFYFFFRWSEINMVFFSKQRIQLSTNSAIIVAIMIIS